MLLLFFPSLGHGLAPATQLPLPFVMAPLLQGGIQLLHGGDPGQGHQEVAPDVDTMGE